MIKKYDIIPCFKFFETVLVNSPFLSGVEGTVVDYDIQFSGIWPFKSFVVVYLIELLMDDGETVVNMFVPEHHLLALAKKPDLKIIK